MALRILNHQLKHLKFLKDQSAEVPNEVCKLVLEVLHNGPNPNRYSSLAEKLNTTIENLQLAIKALVLLIIDAIKNNVSQVDFETAMYVIFTPEQTAIYWSFISCRKEFIENILKHYNVMDLRYRELEWRIETKIASRCLLAQVTPIITIKLFLDTEEIGENKDKLLNNNDKDKLNNKEILLQTDPTNLLHIIDVLEQALIEAKTHRTKNFIKAIQV